MKARKQSPSKAPSPGRGSKSKPKIPSVVHHPEVLPPDEPTDEEENEDKPSDDVVEIEPSQEEMETSALTSRLPELPEAPDASDVAESDVGSAISPADPLRRYFDEVRRHPMLEPEEEFRLAMKLRNEGDMDAARRLVTANLRLVVKIAMEYRSYYSNLLDLIQEGNVGLMKAVSKFDPTKGARLGYYASWWIRSYILKYLLDNFRLVKIGTTQAQKKLFYHLMREKERLEAQGLLAGPKLLAEKLQVREKDVVEMEQRLSGRGAEVSLDAPVGGDDSEPSRSSHLDLLPDSAESAETTVEREELIGLLKEKLPALERDLSERELQILRERLLADEPKTLQEIADRYGLTRERARQIEARILEKLRALMKTAL